jgi:hypothetical protein
MSYVFGLKVNGRVIPVRLLDRLYRLSNRAVMNRTRISKWGVNIGELSVQFEKVA